MPADYVGTPNSCPSGADIANCLVNSHASFFLLILDCCFAEAISRRLLGVIATPEAATRQVYVLAASSTSEAALTAHELDSPLFTFFFVNYAEKHTSSDSPPITACLEQARTLSLALTSLDYGISQTKSRPRLVYSDPKAAHFHEINARVECDARPRRSEPWSTLLASTGLAFPGQSAVEHFPKEFQLWLNGMAMPALQSVAQAGFLRDDRVLAQHSHGPDVYVHSQGHVCRGGRSKRFAS